MRLRSPGNRPFLGCTRYPGCRGLIGNERLSAEQLVEAANPRAAFEGTLPVYFPNYGRSRGAQIEGASLQDLDYYANGARRSLANPSKARYHVQERALLEAIERELARQRGAAAPAAAPPQGGAIAPGVDTFTALVEGEPSVGIVGQRPFYPPTLEECRAVPACTLKLDEHQQRVVNWRTGEALVAAAAGSGKSTVLVERTAALIREGTPPETILSLVYNRSAAEGLRQRLTARLGSSFGPRVHAATFHSWAYSLVREWWPGQFGQNRTVGIDEGPSTLTLGLAAVNAAGLDSGVEIKDLVKLSELAREALIDIAAEDAVQRFIELPVDLNESSAKAGVAFARAYQQEKARRGVIDFADMLYLVNRVISYGGARAKALQMRYQHVQVDESQDVNPARLCIAEFLGAGARSLVWVGDFRQTIYSFTGSRPDLLKSKIADLGEQVISEHVGRVISGRATLLTLPVNRRSTKSIVEAGNQIADGRDWNVGGACQASSDVPAEKVHIWHTSGSGEEADAVAQEIEARTRGSGNVEAYDGVPLANAGGKANYCCLVRTNAQAAGLECSFMLRNMPCRVLGANGGVWSTTVGKELLAYLRAASGRVDKDILKVANKPSRYVKRAIVENALSIAGTDFNVFIAALENAGQKGARQLKLDLSLLAALPWNERVEESVRFLQRDLRERASESAIEEPDDDKSAACKALGDVAVQMGSVEAIDAQIAKMKRVKDRDPAVEICTMHKSKGAEWHTVFTCGVAKGILPHMKARDLEEERRLFYVAVTRAQHVAVISVGGSEPSPFLESLGFVRVPPPASISPELFHKTLMEGPPTVEELSAMLEDKLNVVKLPGMSVDAQRSLDVALESTPVKPFSGPSNMETVYQANFERHMLDAARERRAKLRVIDGAKEDDQTVHSREFSERVQQAVVAVDAKARHEFMRDLDAPERCRCGVLRTDAVHLPEDPNNPEPLDDMGRCRFCGRPAERCICTEEDYPL
jgi:DNA helicase-2/ATP-dependent DNA helicase PcrA